ncbi:MAG: phosphotransferase [Dysgonamonadaceae bacterium]|nr:phosphotransferase [Dysgonamonadaceae bacterium]MDD4727156.1 phosphotransferase [Dysgonamonadaceae bacterium]
MNLLSKALESNFNLSKIGAYVKRHFNYRVLKTMCHLGFYVDNLPSAESFYLKTRNYPLAIKEDELRKITIFLRKANNRKLYGQILQKFVPQMDMKFSHTQFTGSGSGAYNLNAFRKVINNDEVFFEKAHFNSSIEIVRLNWFYDNIFASMKDNNNIKAPALCCSFEGELITIFYFNFVELVSSAEKEVGAIVFNLSRELYKLSQLPDVKDKITEAPIFLRDYKIYFEYERKIEEAEKRASELLGDSFHLKDIENKISESPYILTHGDIHRGNVFADNYLIDWDTFGIYPIGLEVAYILLFLKKCKLSYQDLNDILDREYRTTILEEQWDSFELNCLYFYYVFTIHSSTEIGSSEIQTDILNRIVVLNNKKTVELSSTPLHN